MKNSSDLTRDILTNSNLYELTASDQFVPYLVQKYISGVSPDHCVLINSILNNKLSVWRNEQEIFDLLKCFLPKKKSAFFKYFGKPADKKESKVDLAYLSQTLEIPKKEIREMIDYFPELAENLIEDKEKILKNRK